MTSSVFKMAPCFDGVAREDDVKLTSHIRAGKVLTVFVLLLKY